MSEILFLKEEDLSSVFNTMKQLRAHLTKEEFLARVKTQISQGYILVGIKENNDCVAVAGYRYSLNLAWGKFLYCDDLIVDETHRKKGYAEKLLKFMYQEAQKHSCLSFQLDSAVHRFEAHRLYLKNYMDITCHHFSKNC